METINIEPYNSEKRTKRYVGKFVREIKEKCEEYDADDFDANEHLFYDMFTSLPKGEIVLILNPKMFYIPSTERRENMLTLGDRLFPRYDIVHEQIKCNDVIHLIDTPAKYLGGSGLSYGGDIGESPWEACAGDRRFLCQDGKERFMMNYDVGKGYIFLPHPYFLEKFLKGIEEIPKKGLAKDITNRLRNYYENERRKQQKCRT